MGINQSAIALLSAGLDSSIALAMALKEGVQIKLALTFDYGQKAAPQEIKQASRLASFWRIPHKQVNLPFFAESDTAVFFEAQPIKNFPVYL